MLLLQSLSVLIISLLTYSGMNDSATVRINDSVTQEPLVGVMLTDGNGERIGYTDFNGEIRVDYPSDTLVITANLITYESRTVRIINNNENKVTVFCNKNK